MHTIVRDLTHTLRRLRRDPKFSVPAILTLGLALGAVITIFSAVEGVLLRPLPYGEPEHLVLLWHRAHGDAARSRVPAPDVLEVRRSSRTLESVAFTNNAFDAVMTGAGAEAQHLSVGLVTSNFFSVLGVEPFLGRMFRPDEALLPPEAFDGDGDFDAPPSVLVLGHGLWRSRFGGDPGVLGRTVHLNGAPFSVVGVAPPGFELVMPPDVGLATDLDAWAPLRIPLGRFDRDPGEWQDQDSDNTGAVVARLAPDATLEQARAEMRLLAARQRDEIPFYREAEMAIEVAPMHADSVAHARPALLVLLAAVLFVLLIASLNVAGLLLSRNLGRLRELSLRSALGAGRGRLVWQQLKESSVVAILASGLGLLLAWVGSRLLVPLAPAGLPGLDTLEMNGAVVAFAVGTAVLAALASGLLPALLATRAAAGLLGQRSSGGAPGGRQRSGRSLTAAQVAISLVLLVGAGLMLRSFVRLQELEPGFEPKGLATFRLSLPAGSIGGPADRARFVRGFADRIRSLPGVRAVGIVGGLPLSGEVWTQPYGLEGSAVEDWGPDEANFRVINAGYFEAMGTRLLAGRSFTEHEDLFEEGRVVIVDAALARRIAPNGDPADAVGRRLSFPLDGDPVWAEVVGVVEPVRYESLERPGRPALYVPYRQEASRAVGFAVRAEGDASDLERPVRQVLSEMEAGLGMPLFDFRPMERYLAEATKPTRFVLALIGAFASIALALAAVGLYAGVAYTVRQRRHEIGVRMAIGATPLAVVTHFTRRGFGPVLLGVALGLVLATSTSRALVTLLVGIEPLDLPTYAGVTALMLVVGLMACFVPAREATTVEPLEVLHRE